MYRIKWILLLLAVLAFACWVASCSARSHHTRIEEKVEDMGGVLTEVDNRAWNIGPFHYKGKGDTVYHFEYTLDGKTHVGWVRFGGWNPKWIFEEE